MEQYIRIMICFAGIFVAAISLVIISRVRSSEAQKWTNNAFWALLVYNAANFAKPFYADVTYYIYMTLVIYIATIIAGLSFGFAMMEFCEIKISGRLRDFLLAMEAAVIAFFCIVCTLDQGKYWFGDKITFIVNEQFPYLYDNDWTRGIAYYIGNGALDALIAFYVIFILVKVFQKKGKKSRILRQLVQILILPAAVTVISFTGLIPNSMTNHVTFIILNIVLLIIIIRFDITTTVTDAKEQAVETVNDGIIIMDRHMHFQFANRKAIELFPELGNENPDLITAFIGLEFATDLIRKDGKAFEIRRDVEKDSSGRTRGNLILIHDITEQEDRIREQEKANRAQETLDQAIMAMAQAIDAKDPYTRGHSNRVAKYSKMLAERMHLSEDEIRDIYHMGLLHDIGKIGIDDAIIRKDSKLTDEEYSEIKTHPEKGDLILKNIISMPELHVGARWHHERYDGFGYPDRLKGDEIPLFARIISVADSYDAMSSNRSYRKYMAQDIIRAEIEKGRGSQFDPKIAEIMLNIIDEDTEYTLHE